MIETIRKKIPQEEFDYQTLLDGLGDYLRPRDKISGGKEAVISPTGADPQYLVPYLSFR